jgi:hypothetical protein
MYEDFVKTMNLTRNDIRKLEELKKYEKMEWFKEVAKLYSGQSFGELAIAGEGSKGKR